MIESIGSEPKTEVRACPVCGRTYEANRVRLRHGRQTTCSRKCSYQLRARAKERRVALRCASCGKEIQRARGAVKAQHRAHFCSRECHYAGRSAGLVPRVVLRPYVMTEAGRLAQKAARKKAVATRKKRGNYRHTDATCERLAEATARNIASGKIRRVSKIEDIVAKELSALGVAFARQVAIRGARGRFVACVDFLTSDGIVVEVNGTFWHADPRSYPDRECLAPAQRRTVERYARKINALRESGLHLVEVWESDLRQDSRRAVSEALRRLA